MRDSNEFLGGYFGCCGRSRARGHADLCDRAASAMSAFGQDPKGLEAKPASAVGEAETPIPSSSPNQYKGGGG